MHYWVKSQVRGHHATRISVLMNVLGYVLTRYAATDNV